MPSSIALQEAGCQRCTCSPSRLHVVHHSLSGSASWYGRAKSQHTAYRTSQRHDRDHLMITSNQHTYIYCLFIQQGRRRTTRTSTGGDCASKTRTLSYRSLAPYSTNALLLAVSASSVASSVATVTATRCLVTATLYTCSPIRSSLKHEQNAAQSADPNAPLWVTSIGI